MNNIEPMMEQFSGRARAASEAVQTKAIEIRDEGLKKIGVDPSELNKLHGVVMLCAFVSLLINLLLLGAMSNFAWIKGTALADGQPFHAYLSLTGVQFGTPENPTVDNKYFCEEGRHQCGLGELCKLETSSEVAPNGLLMDTASEDWCKAARAGATAASLLWIGFIPSLAATAFTGMYAAKEVQVMTTLMSKVENMIPNAERIEKLVICGCWAGLWVFMFVAMTTYAAMIPDSLGWGAVELEASFGLLRLNFVLTSVFGAILASYFFDLWKSENVVEAWLEFQEAKLMSAKKALYLELMLQLMLYLFMIIAEVDWSALLIVLAAFYLDAKNKNFLLMYVVLVTISILFDAIHFAELPAFSQMTPGESFGASLWICIFLLKPLILATIFAYETYESANEDGPYTDLGEPVGRDDEIAE